MTYQPSPYQTQTPTFASPLDQLANEFSDPAGPSGSRGAILDRAFSLTRGNRVTSKKNDAHNRQQGLNERIADQQQRSMNVVQTSQSKVDDTTDDRARVQRLREARLSQQQNFVAGQSLPAQHGSSQAHSMTNAFRDSIASDISFNTISGAQDRSSMMMDAMSQSPNAGRGNVVSNVDTDVARELQGLALRRRPSLDTVRSSEFGDEGRWARAWAGSDDDEEEEDEMDLQAMRAHDLSDFDLESRPQRHAAGLGALGDLGNLSGARAAMHQQTNHAQQPRSPQPAFRLPELKSVSGAEHAVSITSAQAGRAGQGMNNAGTGHDRGLLPRAHQPQRRDTLISIAGEVGEVVQETDLEARTVGSVSAASSPESTHVKVWPPTPAGSQQRTSGAHYNGGEGTVPSGPKRDALSVRDLEQGQSIGVMQGRNDLQSRQNALPVSPSAAIMQGHAVWPTSRQEEAIAYSLGYSDPNRSAAGEIALDGLGERRRRAIAQHGGRESLVSDLDVITLRLDGASTAAGDRADVSSRRGSSSTIGTVSSDVLDEMRKRRSQMEHEDAIAAGLAADKRSSTATVRNVPLAHLEGPRRPSNSPPIPRRSNTNPEDQQQHNKVNAQLSPAPWATQNTTRPLRNSTGAEGHPVPSPFQLLSPTLSSTKPQRSPSSSSAPPPQSQAEKFLTLGISHHESGDLSRSAFYFERSAKIDGGCVVGMCMWGMALREGWGVRKDQKRGFEWISRAASRAGEMMAEPKGSTKNAPQKTEAELKAIRSELKLSVYELGKCFCYGWGVKMDKQMALEYFELAAKLGDSDAQAEAGALLAAGKGCKKDLKKAAMYYRMAEAQGYDTVGLSWIHKDKYDPAGQTPTTTATTTTTKRVR